MHHTLTGIRPTFLHPSSFPPSSFSQGATSHALGKQTPTEPFQKNSMKSKLFGNKPTPSTQAPQQDTPTCTTPSGIHPTLLASFLLSAFLLSSRHHFPCSWQTNTNTAISEKLNEKQTLWQQTHPFHTGTPTDTPTQGTPTHAPTGTLQHAPPQHKASQQDTPACTTPSQASAPPFFHPLPPFLKAPLPMLLANKHQHSHFKKV